MAGRITVMRHLRGGERGSGTVAVVGFCLVALCVAIALVGLGHAGACRGRAQAAADLGALAGAQHVLDGGAPSEACPQAAAVVARNGASLLECAALPGEKVLVRASVPLRFPSFAQGLKATAAALAGPPAEGRVG